jgi:hypothetical protein
MFITNHSAAVGYSIDTHTAGTNHLAVTPPAKREILERRRGEFARLFELAVGFKREAYSVLATSLRECLSPNCPRLLKLI